MEKLIDGVEYLIRSSSIGASTASVQDLVVSNKTRKKNVTIPAYIDGVPVVGILQDAFQDAAWIEEITLPSTLQAIGAGAFDNCKKMKKVRIDGCDMEVDIYRNAFSRCYALEEIDMGDNCSIFLKGQGVFKDCTMLKSLPPILENIPQFTFLRCGLEEVIIWGNAHLGSDVFTHCNLKKIYCENLESVDGDWSPFKEIQIVSPQLTEVMENMAYYGYPIAVSTLPLCDNSLPF